MIGLTTIQRGHRSPSTWFKNPSDSKFLSSRFLGLEAHCNICKERLVEQNQELNRQCPLWRAEIRDFCGHRSCLSRNCSFPGAVTSELLLVVHRGEWGSSLGPNLVLLHWVLQPLICCLWVLNCKATFLGTEPRALEEGQAFKLCFLSSFPSAGALVLAGHQSPGIPVLCSGCSSWLRSQHSPPFCMVSAGSVL